ncbi:outer membrane protein [Yoonia sp. I 8.24]|uniref:outer membrane protein n=1 Tax=Yoonia sp. I 8.24 TaxID=1537229 RepID=UPI001EDE2585|nr:outer membrane beta-barrel protein [Yoonia sp. I 8.24]MCG3267361.1 porin family protein [Yoonia sp. I 8.24]
MTQFTPTKVSIAACAALLISSAPAFAGGLSNEIVEPEPMAPMAAAGSDYYFTGAIGSSVGGNFEGYLGSFDVEGTFDPSALVRLGAGYNISELFRVEVEVSYRRLAIGDEFERVSAGFLLDSDGEAATTTFMLNGLYDIDLPTSTFDLYVGGGLGMASVDVDFRRGPDGLPPGFQLIEGSFTAPAAQLRLGAERELANGMRVFADYTYLYVTETEFDGYNDGLGDVEQIFSPLDSHEIAIGVRYGF